MSCSASSARGLKAIAWWSMPAVALLICVLWTLVVGPWVNEYRADLAFLRYARSQAIEQQQRQSQQPGPAATPETKQP